MRPYEKIVAIIQNELEQNQSRAYDVKTIAAKVISETNASTNARGVALTLEVMKALGKVRYFNGRYLYKPPEDDDNEAAQAVRDEMGRKIAAMMESHSVELHEVQHVVKDLNDRNRELARQVEQSSGQIKTIVIKNTATKKTVKMTEIFHRKFAYLQSLVENRIDVYMYGPTGSGKTHIAEQLARANSLKFASASCTAGMPESVFTGQFLPSGPGGRFEFIPTEFVTLFEGGGLWTSEEMDGMDSNTLLIQNTALANGYLPLPKRRTKPKAHRHKDFVYIGIGNTVGTGADRVYSGRNKLDMSTMERFFKVYIDYDHVLEQKLCPDNELLMTCWKIRKAINDNMLERAMSTRFIGRAYKLKTVLKFTHEQIFGFDGYDGFFAGWREDEINKVRTYL